MWNIETHNVFWVYVIEILLKCISELMHLYITGLLEKELFFWVHLSSIVWFEEHRFWNQLAVYESQFYYMPELFLQKCTEMFCVWITSSLKWSWLVKSLLFSVTQSCPTLWDPMDCSTPGFRALCYLLMFVQTSVHWISDAVQPSHPLLPLSPPPLYLLQHQGLSQRAISSHQVTKCWSFSFSISPSINYSGLISLGLSGLISLLTKGLSTVFFSTTVWKYQFLYTQPSLWSNCHIHTWLLEKMYIWLYRPLSAKWCLWFLICCLSPS